MASFWITGGKPLYGEIRVQGSKNAVLPVMAASVLRKGVTVLSGVPLIEDVYAMLEILKLIGVKVCLLGHELVLDASGPVIPAIPREQMIRMRSSIILLGALLGRCREAEVFYPGGCLIGKRPIDLHLKAMEAFGAEVEEEGERLRLRVGTFSGTRIQFPFPSVGATENALLAAAGAQGTTLLSGCAREPEISALCLFLQSMGVPIKGIGTERLIVTGGRELKETAWAVPGDRIVAGTYLAYTAGCGGRILVTGVDPAHMVSTLSVLEQAGCRIQKERHGVWCEAVGRPCALPYLKTEPYPGFPTDMQSLLLPVFALAKGRTVLEETIFEGRFQAALELQKMGADVRVSGRRIIIEGIEELRGGLLTAADLRGGAALTGAALMARGESRVDGISHMMRGYESLEEDIRAMGGEIRRTDETEED